MMINRDVIKKYKEVFNWWAETGGYVWVKHIIDVDTWSMLTHPKWDDEDLIYVQDDKYAKFRKAIADGKPVYLDTGDNTTKLITNQDFCCHPSSYSLTGPRWRAAKEENYWYICSEGHSDLTQEMGWNIDNNRYNAGNYFRTKAQAEAVINKIKPAFCEDTPAWVTLYTIEV